MASTALHSLPTKTCYTGPEKEEILKLLENPESITVIVGSQDAATAWHLPKALLTRQSLFFAGALNGSFAEAKLNLVTMPDDDPNVFRLWVSWLLFGQFTRNLEDTNNSLLKAWILGDKLGCHTFQDLVMTRLLACHSPKLGQILIEPSDLRAAYEGSAPGSKLRKWALDFFLFVIGKNRDGTSSALQQNILWVAETKDIEDFSQDHMEASVQFSLQAKPENPYTNWQQYMVGSSYMQP